MNLNKKDKMVVELHRFNLQSTNYKRANIWPLEIFILLDF
jgi:hypothetical protein